MPFEHVENAIGEVKFGERVERYHGHVRLCKLIRFVRRNPRATGFFTIQHR